jgi:hypothetical protein
MFEHRHELLLPCAAFILRLIRHSLISLGIVLGALGIGVIGYHKLVNLGWIDSTVNAAMILGGMGPVADLKEVPPSGKLFAAGYALFSGLIFIVIMGVMLAPVLHRLMHRFHLEPIPKLASALCEPVCFVLVEQNNGSQTHSENNMAYSR